MQRAVAAYEAGNLADAATLCELVLRADPKHLDAINVLGALGMRRGDLPAALEYFSRATEIAPDFAEAFNNRGVVLQQLQRWDEALKSYRRALQLRPEYVDALFNMGFVMAQLHRWDEAAQAYKRIVDLRPDHPQAHNNRGNVLLKLRRWQDALQSYERALQLKPDYAEALNNRGVVLRELKQWREALESYDQAVAAKPAFAEAFSNRGVALKELNRWDDALRSIERSLELQPDYPEAFNNRGMVLQELRRWEEALQSYQRAMDLRDDYAEPRWNMALLDLLLGDYKRGWEMFEWRWKTEDIAPLARRFSQPLWLGQESLAGRTLLVHAEQGQGDIIQFSRFVALLDGDVVFEVPRSLVRIMTSSFPRARVVARDTQLPAFDLHCPLASLPLAFNTTVDSIPAPASYLAAENDLQRQWLARLGEKRRPRVGLAWAGNPAQRNDHNRSFEFSRLLPLLDLDLEFHSLQKDLRGRDKEDLLSSARIRPWHDELNDFADTAALICGLDLVISIDTSVAHLSGALGAPTWILLSRNADYRYLLDRDDSPWYPSARLFRQATMGDWGALVERVRLELGNHFKLER
jgi:tetratricopeptide (TPR) repeat protein